MLSAWLSKHGSGPLFARMAQHHLTLLRPASPIATGLVRRCITTTGIRSSSSSHGMPTPLSKMQPSLLQPRFTSYTPIGMQGYSRHLSQTTRTAAETPPISNVNPRYVSPKLRTKRPMSPHLTIYQPQLTWLMSGLHRATGAALTGGLYLGAMVYAVAPWNTAAAVAAVHAMPWAVVVLGKLAIAAPLTYHTYNGIRHLAWDWTTNLNNAQVYRSGYITLAFTAITTLALVLCF